MSLCTLWDGLLLPTLGEPESAILLYSGMYIALKITEIPVYQEQGTFKYVVLKIASGLAVSNDAMC